jgi:predicted  nucleic acid-binding Zn-ribbon protein
MIEAEQSAIAETFADVRRVLLAAVEQAERMARRRGAAQVQQLIEATRACASDLDAQIGQAIDQLQNVRASLAAIQARVASVAGQIEADEPEPEPTTEAAAAAPQPPPAVSGEETVRVLRAALEVLSRQRNGGA